MKPQEEEQHSNNERTLLIHFQPASRVTAFSSLLLDEIVARPSRLAASTLTVSYKKEKRRLQVTRCSEA